MAEIMEPRVQPFPLDYAVRRRDGARWIAIGEIASVVAAIGVVGAVVTVCLDLVRDPRGWEANDALVLFCGAGSLAALLSLACFGTGRLWSPFAFRRRCVVGVWIDAISLCLLCVWVVYRLA